MIITVASGKGGTGKTMVAVNLALSIASRRQSVQAPKRPGDESAETLGRYDATTLFLDCDVEAPNAYLFLKPTFKGQEEVTLLAPEIDFDKCTYCGRCAEACNYNALAVVRDQVLFFSELCHGCGACALVCPEGAIHEVPEVIGLIEEGVVSTPLAGLDFAHGVLEVGRAIAPPVIRQLKRRIDSDGLVILDASPGTSCPVVEAMKGADFVLLVTEPTPFGLHDLRLTVEVARDELGLPVGVVINRDGIGDEKVEAYCQSEGIPILMRIPFDRRIAEVYSEGGLVIQALPEYRAKFTELYLRIADQIRGNIEEE
jgi:MinD superfamily P-loop ATPase